MAYAKKNVKTDKVKKSDEARIKLEKLDADIADGNCKRAYLFYGEEAYLRDNYLKKMKNALVNDIFEAFNYHKLDGGDINLNVEMLRETAEAMPVMADRSLIILSDYDLFRVSGGQRDDLILFLKDIPEWACIVFVYDTIEYKANKSVKKLYDAIYENIEIIEFHALEQRDLIKWITGEFKKLNKNIASNTAEYLIFTRGDLMTGLLPEIGKLAAYASGDEITERDIDAVCEPILSTEVFRLSDAVLKGDYNRAAGILSDLLKARTEPILLLATLGGQLRRIYTARLAWDNKKNKDWLADLWGMKDYPAKLLYNSAKNADLDWCANAVRECENLDRRMKSEGGLDAEGELKLLLARLGASRKAKIYNI